MGTYKRLHTDEELAKQLYLHVVYITNDEANLEVFTTILSAKNTKIESLAILKTYLGSTFSYQCNGFNWTGGIPFIRMNEHYIEMTTDGYFNWDTFNTWSDKVYKL